MRRVAGGIVQAGRSELLVGRAYLRPSISGDGPSEPGAVRECRRPVRAVEMQVQDGGCRTSKRSQREPIHRVIAIVPRNSIFSRHANYFRPIRIEQAERLHPLDRKSTRLNSRSH